VAKMWEDHDGRRSEDVSKYTTDSKYGSEIVCEIKKVCTINEIDHYSGTVYSYDGDSIYIIEGTDLEVLKLSCLITANDMGWCIKNIY
tara:strand:- start:589 stop:852 length:264 start_codon:yes stop_codon:yes gene_type:complete